MFGKMDGKEECLRTIKQLFKAAEPKGGGKIHKKTLMDMMRKGCDESFDDESLEDTIKKMKPDKKGMITPEGYFRPFSLAENTPEEVAAVRNIFENYPQLIEGAIDWKSLAESIGFDRMEELDKMLLMIRRCYLDSLGRRLKEEPPKSEELVKRKQAQLLRAYYEQMEEESKKKE